MAKTQTAFFCQNCGAQSSKWIGRCNSCGEWNTYVEEVIHRDNKHDAWQKISSLLPKPRPITEISSEVQDRLNTNNQEFNRVLGGGLVPGSVILVGGEPGIGKSTLMLQIALNLPLKVLYISGEESQEQILMRAKRLGIHNPNCYLYNETTVQNIARYLGEMEPQLVVVDSIQTLTTESIDSTAGSISQVRECAAQLQKFAKQTHTPVVLIGHITKDGMLAGPKILEHMVDTVLQFEGDRHYGYRILRAMKNRFGSTAELGIYEMTNSGLREVSNPSEILLSQREEEMSGISIAANIEGMRPMLIEIQALVSSAVYGTPQRSTTGFDPRRLNMLLAVLEKRMGFHLGAKDVFLNITGGIRVDDPAIDMAVIASVLSSVEDIPINHKTCFAGEVGLSGEIRTVNKIDQRIAEAQKLGFEKIYISKYNLKGIDTARSDIEIIPVARVNELHRFLFKLR
ncbi:MAG: DNA repair protein RadA [Bacteroidales bacterium]|nr:DNA repair protein RadA [Bacteroidales bacterium]MDZ4203969.1 DNA repair protein RadA [Bacteroidales bacterium]